MAERGARADRPERWPAWGSFAVTLLLVVFALELVVAHTLDGLAGAIIGSVCTYWLPATRGRGDERNDG